MEWARETAKNATNTVLDPVRDKHGDAIGTESANQAYDAAANPSDTASAAYDTASDYIPDVSSGKVTAAAVLNSAPFRSFKPDPSIVWEGYLIYVILAAASTLPWWAFIFAADYFQYLYPGTHIIRLLAFAYYVPWLIAYLLVTFFWREGSSWVKINLGGAAAIVTLVVIPLMNGIFIAEKGTTVTFWVTLAMVAIAGAADAISQGSLLGVAAELPQSFTKAYSCGTVASGVFVFIVRLITKLSLSSSANGLRISGIVYFSVAAFFVVLALALLSYVHCMPEMGYYNSLNLGSFDTVRLLIQDEENVTIEVPLQPWQLGGPVKPTPWPGDEYWTISKFPPLPCLSPPFSVSAYFPPSWQKTFPSGPNSGTILCLFCWAHSSVMYVADCSPLIT